MPEIETWMKKELVPSFVYGGNGIVGISQTDFYKFITSADGLSQLGIEASEPPKLLDAYAKTAFKVRRESKHIVLEFGNYVKLKAATPHPADGTGNLHISSWLEWVDGRGENSGYVPRSKLSEKASKSIRLQDPLGGLMLPRGAYGSTGLWKFPTELRNYEDKWFQQNVTKIQAIMTQKMIEIFTMKLVT